MRAEKGDRSLPFLSSTLKGEAETTASMVRQAANETIMLRRFPEVSD